MEYTEQQKNEIKESFSKRRKAQIIVAIPMLAAMFSVILADEQSGTVLGFPIGAALPIMAVVILAGFVFSFKNWRCPACNKYLGKGLSPNHCHACGVQLR